MKIGVNLWVWTSPFNTNRDLALLGKVKSLGGEAIEFGLEDDVVIEPGLLHRELAAYELGCSVIGLFGPERDLSSENSRSREQAFEYAKRGLDVSAEVGASIFSGAIAGVGGESGISSNQWEKRIRRVADGLEELGQYAVRIGVRLGVEVLNRYENNLINTAEQARRLIDQIQSASVGIHLDCFHMNIEEEDIAKAILQVGDKLFHLHASDSHRGIPGDGHVAWDQVKRALNKIRYEGYATIESFNPDGRLASLARIWRPYSASPDALARQGLDFLRETLLNGALD